MWLDKFPPCQTDGPLAFTVRQRVRSTVPRQRECLHKEPKPQETVCPGNSALLRSRRILLDPLMLAEKRSVVIDE